MQDGINIAMTHKFKKLQNIDYYVFFAFWTRMISVKPYKS